MLSALLAKQVEASSRSISRLNADDAAALRRLQANCQFALDENVKELRAAQQDLLILRQPAGSA